MRLSSLFSFSLFITLAFTASCTIKDYRTGNTYDLSPLTKTIGTNWRVTTDQYVYLLNICNSLVPESVTVGGEAKQCDTTAQGCQIDTKNADQSPKVLGKSPALSLVDDSVKLTVTGGGTCKSAEKDRSFVIMFHCNKNAGIGAPRYVDEETKCLYMFDWETSVVCPTTTGTSAPPTTKDCTYHDLATNTIYDLTALSLSRDNWVVNEGEYSYLINICASVNSFSDCKGHSVCQTKPSDNTFSKTLGLDTARPYMENGDLKMKFTGGQLCHKGEANEAPRQTIIMFTCKEGQSLGKPRFIAENDGCVYYFEWESSAACGDALETKCTAYDSTKKTTVDLTSLAKTGNNKNWEVSTAVPGDESSYKLNLCGTLTDIDNPCRAGISICQVANGVGRSLGSVGSLIADDGDIIMRYQDGDLCKNSNTRITSDIYFICDPSAKADSAPRLLSTKDDCQYLFKWNTAAACEGLTIEEEDKGTSGGLIAFIVIISLMATYLIVGVLYNRFVKGEKGVHQIPHFAFCQAGYEMAEDCFARNRHSSSGAIQL